MTADLARRLRDVADHSREYGSGDRPLLREAADAIDSLTTRRDLAEAAQQASAIRIDSLTAERDGYIAAWHGADARAVAAEAEAREWDATLLECSEQRSRLAAAERVVEAARAVRAKYPAHAETADLQMDAALRDYEKAYSGGTPTDHVVPEGGSQEMNMSHRSSSSDPNRLADETDDLDAYLERRRKRTDPNEGGVAQMTERHADVNGDQSVGSRHGPADLNSEKPRG